MAVMRNKPLKTTRQRKLMLEELRRAPCHPTADELHNCLRKRLPNISLSTVYRNLDLLCQAGQVLKLESGGYQARFDGTVAPHAHVRCIHCSRVADVRVDLLLDPKANARAAEGYEILNSRLEFDGICPACSTKRKKIKLLVPP